MLTYCPLSSSSKGNCHFAATKRTAVLIDAGGSAKSIKTQLACLDISPQRLDGILITHEHIDHIAALDVLCKNFEIPVYANEKTAACIIKKYPRIERYIRYFKTGENFYINDLDITPFKTPHDCAESVGFSLYSGIRKLTIATDIGHISKQMLEQFRHSHILVLEANHDMDMLLNGPYPPPLKRRIMGNNGHLSNDACGEALSHLLSCELQQVVLAHLSQENNRPEIAYGTVSSRLSDEGCDLPVDVAYQDRRGPVYRIK